MSLLSFLLAFATSIENFWIIQLKKPELFIVYPPGITSHNNLFLHYLHMHPMISIPSKTICLSGCIVIKIEYRKMRWTFLRAAAGADFVFPLRRKNIHNKENVLIINAVFCISNQIMEKSFTRPVYS